MFLGAAKLYLYHAFYIRQYQYIHAYILKSHHTFCVCLDAIWIRDTSGFGRVAKEAHTQHPFSLHNRVRRRKIPPAAILYVCES